MSIEDTTRKKKDQRLTIFFMLVLLMGTAIMVINSEESSFNASCIRCYFCTDRCPVKAINLDEHGYPIINKSKCLAWVPEKEEFEWERCGLCLKGCPTKVIANVNDPDEMSKKTVD